MHLLIKAICVSIFLLVLTIIPVPNLFGFTKPMWLWLLAIYVQYYLPNYKGFMLILFFGLCVDTVLQSPLLGEQALLIFVIMCLAAGKQYRFLLWQPIYQILWVFLLILTGQIMLGIINAFLGYSIQWLYIIGSTLVTTLIWPLFQKIALSYFADKQYHTYKKNNIF